ncbi:membrane-bound ClpP family serine protease [Variovorax boronicumulans]|uniref:hypothetical protein n=1 Tax=Variovorax TaxID=34072 RepID=UPI00277F3425|nr:MULTISPECIES: hypothetical protein [Variovorax]MDQ0036120.1 membrane-bound ClpP family serine protease [Variovorax boronicumulans]
MSIGFVSIIGVACLAGFLLGGILYVSNVITATGAYVALGGMLAGGIVLVMVLCFWMHIWTSRKPVSHITLMGRVVEAHSDNSMVLNQYVIRLVVEFETPSGERGLVKVTQAVDLIDMAGYARGRKVLLHRGSRGGKEVAWVSQPDPLADEGAAA